MDIEKIAELSLANSGMRHNPLRKAAFIGGSVTQGYNPNENVTPYPEIVKKRIEEITRNDLEILNIGISGTTSVMGILQTENQVNKFAPDIVFVEYAINEALTPKGTQAFESLIRKLLFLPCKPDVAIISVYNKDLYSCQEFMTLTAKHYNLPAVQLMNGLKPYIDDGKLAWEDYSPDLGHPTAFGHEIITECVVKAVFAAEKGSCEIPMPLFGSPFESVQLYDLSVFGKTEKFYDFNAVLLDKKLTLDEEFSVLIIMFRQCNDNDTASAKVIIDGKNCAELQGNSIFGWNNPYVKIVFEDRTKKYHHVEIATVKGNENKPLLIGAIGIM